MQDLRPTNPQRKLPTRNVRREATAGGLWIAGSIFCAIGVAIFTYAVMGLFHAIAMLITALGVISMGTAVMMRK